MNEYMTVDYEDRYKTLVKVFRAEVIDNEEKKDRMLTQLRHYMIENAQIGKELDDARELIDRLLKPVDKSENKRDY